MTAPTNAPAPTSPYVIETLALLGSQDPLAILRETPEWILARIGPLDFSVVSKPEGPGKWSLTQVLAHLADSEIAYGWRARLVLTENSPPLQGFDEAAWMTRFGGATVDATEAMLTFTSLRSWNLAVWESATSAADLARVGVHSERGPESFDTLRRLAAGHDLRHRRQIDRIIASAG